MAILWLLLLAAMSAEKSLLLNEIEEEVIELDLNRKGVLLSDLK